MSDVITNGWARDHEDFSFLHSLPVADDELRAMRGHYQETKLDPRKVLKCENQGNMGSCRGHSGSTGLEWIRSLQTGTPSKQLSRMMMYIETQRRDGLVGAMAGSTIGNGIKQMKEVGICGEELWPYTGRYSMQRPSNWEEVLLDSSENKIRSAIQIKSYDAFRTFLGSNQGFVDCGISWNQSYASKVVESFSGGRSGHAIAVISLSERLDSKGRPYVWMFNSHGLSSGDQGWTEWSPNFVEQACRHSWTEFVGVSDMPALAPREFTLQEWIDRVRA